MLHFRAWLRRSSFTRPFRTSAQPQSGSEQMQLTLAVDRDVAGEEGAALRDWLSREDTLRGQAQVLVDNPTPAGAMGQSLEVVNIVLSNTLAVGNLVVAVAAWRQSRPTQPIVHIRANGGSFTLETGERVALEALTQDLREARRPEGATEE